MCERGCKEALCVAYKSMLMLWKFAKITTDIHLPKAIKLLEAGDNNKRTTKCTKEATSNNLLVFEVLIEIYDPSIYSSSIYITMLVVIFFNYLFMHLQILVWGSEGAQVSESASIIMIIMNIRSVYVNTHKLFA